MSLSLRPGSVNRPGRPPRPKSPAADKGALVGERVGRGLLRKGPAAMSGSLGGWGPVSVGGATGRSS